MTTEYKHVLVYKENPEIAGTIENIDMPKKINVTYNFQIDEELGVAKLYKKDKSIFANIKLDKPFDISWTPAIGIIVNKTKQKLSYLSLCDSANTDDSIKSLKEQSSFKQRKIHE